jgi:hypothetical protein
VLRFINRGDSDCAAISSGLPRFASNGETLIVIANEVKQSSRITIALDCFTSFAMTTSLMILDPNLRGWGAHHDE